VTPKRPKLPQFVHFAPLLIMGVVRNLKFGLQVNGSKRQPADVKSSLKWAWSGSRDTFFEFYTP